MKQMTYKSNNGEEEIVWDVQKINGDYYIKATYQNKTRYIYMPKKITDRVFNKDDEGESR